LSGAAAAVRYQSADLSAVDDAGGGSSSEKMRSKSKSWRSVRYWGIWFEQQLLAVEVARRKSSVTWGDKNVLFTGGMLLHRSEAIENAGHCALLGPEKQKYEQ
jgi:hypothetical protein